MNMLIKNGTIIPMNSETPNSFVGDIAIQDDIIAYIKPSQDAAGQEDTSFTPEADTAAKTASAAGNRSDTTASSEFIPDEIIDASNCIIIPGLVNAHTHLAMTLMRNYYDDMDLFTWLNDYIWPLEAKLTPEAVYHGSRLGVIECIRSGVTTFSDMYFEQEQTIAAVSEGGIRAHIGATFMGDASDTKERLPRLRELVSEHSRSADGRIGFDAAPHAIYTCTKETLTAARDFAQEFGIRLHIHMSESRQEVENCWKEHGMSPFSYLDSIDFFSRPVYAAHCVHLDTAEKELCREKSISVIHNPSSNLKLGNGFAPVTEYVKRGITVGLGTDGASSNNNLNMMEEMHLASLIHKGIEHDPTALEAYDVLKMATMGGARALGEENHIGSLEPGKKADMVFVSTNSPNLTPRGNPFSAAVYSAQAADIEAVICNGTFLLRDGRVLAMDEEAVLRKADETAAALQKMV